VTGDVAPDDPVDRPEHDVSKSDLEGARELVLRAFAAAKSSGRADWRRMTTAVLKNRLLDLTDRSFDEAEWGATTTREFVERLAPTLALDFSTRPTTVILHPDVDVGDQEKVVATEPARRRGEWRIRQDLWDAVLDCVSGHAYVWDGSHAVQLSPEDLEQNTAVLLPTVMPEELTAWREAFASEIPATIDSDLQNELDRWRQSAASSQMLPQRYRNRWYGVLKRHVRARLDEWFAEHAVEPPSDWIASSAPPRPAAGDETEHLRSVALRAVRMMRREELERLDIPLSVVARLSQ
jgi:hypothetical protein